MLYLGHFGNDFAQWVELPALLFAAPIRLDPYSKCRDTCHTCQLYLVRPHSQVRFCVCDPRRPRDRIRIFDRNEMVKFGIFGPCCYSFSPYSDSFRFSLSVGATSSLLWPTFTQSGVHPNKISVHTASTIYSWTSFSHLDANKISDSFTSTLCPWATLPYFEPNAIWFFLKGTIYSRAAFSYFQSDAVRLFTSTVSSWATLSRFQPDEIRLILA
jgi:hypothetical protein